MSGITITDTSMTSPATPHTAAATGQGWKVSWLPGRMLTRDQATTAMVIANLVGCRGVPRADDPGRGDGLPPARVVRPSDDVIPPQRAGLLGTDAGQQAQRRVGVHARGFRGRLRHPGHWPHDRRRGMDCTA